MGFAFSSKTAVKKIYMNNYINRDIFVYNVQYFNFPIKYIN